MVIIMVVGIFPQSATEVYRTAALLLSTNWTDRLKQQTNVLAI